MTLPRHLTLAAVLAGVLAASAAAQPYYTVARESFDYPALVGLGQLDGGEGWFVPWYSGPTDTDAIIIAPGVDAIGNQVVTALVDGGSYRRPNTGNFQKHLSNGQFGADNTTIWISFDIKRTQNGTDEYGGLSLFTFFGGEKLFLGAPFQAFQWGIDYPTSGGAVVLAPSNIDQQSRLTYRIDYLPGMERVRMWIDPVGGDYPQYPPDIDTMVPDHVWNEVRLQSGGSGGVPGFEFDDIVIASENAPAVFSYGAGCAGFGGFTPKLAVTSALPPTSGGPFDVALTDGLGASTALLFVGFGQAQLPLSPGCFFNIATVIPSPITLPLGGTGAGDGSITIPTTLPAGLTGLIFNLQAFVIDPGVPRGYSSSPGLQVEVF